MYIYKEGGDILPNKSNKGEHSINESFEIRKGVTDHDNSSLAAMRTPQNNNSSNSNNNNRE